VVASAFHDRAAVDDVKVEAEVVVKVDDAFGVGYYELVGRMVPT
jgi:hypothetical protein